MKHIDWRVLVLFALPLVPAVARAQFVGQANDAAQFNTAPTQMGEIRMPGDPSAPAVTRTIEADFYGDFDVDDWYLLKVVDESTSTSCLTYGALQLAVTPTGASVLSGGQSPGVMGDTPGTGPAENSDRLVHRFPGDTCGATQPYYIHVQRPSGVPVPSAYTLHLELTRDFQGRHVISISPTSGPPGTAVTITGDYLIPLVKFGDVSASITSFTTSNTSTGNSGNSWITAIVPPGAKTGPITVYAWPSQQVFTVMSAAVVSPNRSSAATPPASGCCVVVANPALVGRLGKLVVAFPQTAVPSGTKIAVVKDGRELQSGYGSQSWELLPGSYDLSVSGKTITNVSVQARSDTTVHVGVLRVTASSQTQWEVLDAGKTIASGYGMQLVGLPAGSYALRISGQTESFTIRDGQVTDF